MDISTLAIPGPLLIALAVINGLLVIILIANLRNRRRSA